VPILAFAGHVALSGEPFLLVTARRHDAFADLRGGFAGPFGGDLAKLHRRHLHMNVDPVQQRARNPIQIILNPARRTARFAGHLAVRRRVHRRNQHELRRKSHRAGRARNRDPAFLQRQRRQNRRQPFGEHRLARAWRPNEQHVISGHTSPLPQSSIQPSSVVHCAVSNLVIGAEDLPKALQYAGDGQTKILQ